MYYFFLDNETRMDSDDSINESKKEYVNGQGVRFTTQIPVPFTSNINSFHSIL